MALDRVRRLFFVLALLCAARAHADQGLDYLERVDGGARAEDRLPLIVVIHGRGDRPENFRAFLPALTRPARLVFLRAPTPLGSGYTWFDPSSTMDDARAVHAMAERIASFIATLETKRPTRGRPIVMGFSQGGVLSYALAALEGDHLARVIPISGRLPPGYLSRSSKERPAPVFALHGEADPVIALTGAQTVVADLKRAGGSAELRTYPAVGHTISHEMAAELDRLLTEAVELQAR